MAMTLTQQKDAYQFFIIAFGAAPGIVYMDQLDEAYASGMSTQDIVNVYTTKPQFTALYPNFLSSEEFAISLVNNVVKNSASDETKAEAVADIQAALASGMTRGDVIYQVFTNLANLPTTDAKWGGTVALFNNQVAVAEYYTETLLGNSTDVATLQTVVSGVTATSDVSSPAAIDALLADPVVTLFSLTIGQDVVSGSSFGDLFSAVVVQNALGAQVNTLGSGDVLDGNGGVDTLNATITSGVFAGGSYSMPIQPKTSEIEIVKIEAVSADIGGTESLSGNSQIYVNAKDMVDVEQLWSSRSDADLIIQNLTTKGLGNLSDMTIGMEYTGNDDSRWDESDMTVYFDQDYLTPESTRTNPAVDFLAMNEDNYDATDGTKPLDGVFFRELKFQLNDVYFDLKPYLNENSEGNGSEITTYAEFLAAVQEALIALKADNAGNAALQTVEASFGANFTTDANPDTLELRVGTSVRLTVDGLTDGVQNDLTVVSTDLEVARAAKAIVPNNNRYELADDEPAVEGAVLAINVALEKVGLAGDGGELIIGSMNKTEANDWDAVNTVTDTTSGIEQFNVTVYGANDKSSSLAGLHSTNNNLRVVNVVTDAALTGTSFADLTIGNSNTDGLSGFSFNNYDQALKDVQTFNASGFKGDLTVFAALTDEVADKYLNLLDEAAAAPGADNVAFAYTGGTGDDEFNITLSAANFEVAGTTTREDMTVNVAGGEGDDMITLAIVNSEDNSIYDSVDDQGLALAKPGNGPGYANWYDNQELNANLSIDGGAGDDTIWTPGSGDVIIDGGAGNDTVYADNTGDKAVWAYNVAGANAVFPILSRSMLDNLQSDVNNSYKLFETDVVVNFKGFEVKAAIATKNGVAKDLDINQAIKKAINSDPVLSKLLEAKDGPANTLVVSSLIDGNMVDDLSISLEGPAAADLSSGDVNQLTTWYGSSFAGTTAAGYATYFAEQATAFDTKADYAENFARDSTGFNGVAYAGGISEHTSDNTITGGLGNDVLVLGTAKFSNDTVVYEDFGNGTDSIVNFTGSGFNSDIQNVVTIDPDSYTQGAAAVTAVTTPVAEKFTLEVTAANTDGTITFDGATITLVGTETVAQVVALFDAATYSTYTATAGTTPSTVVFTETVPGGTDLPNAAVSSFIVGGPPAVAGVLVAVVNNVNGSTTTTTPGVTAATEFFQVTFSQADTDTTYTFDGESIPVLAAETGTNIASAVWTGNYANWDASLVDADTVQFTSKTANANVTDATEASFVGANVEAGTFGFTSASDFLDFSAYNAQAVIVNGAAVVDMLPTTGVYISMTEGTDLNEGSYTINHVNLGATAATTDDVTTLIGVANFGEHQDFVAQNFII